MNDPRAKVFTALEGIDGGNELKDSLKAWIENEVSLKMEANNKREEALASLEKIKGEYEELKAQPPVAPADGSDPRVAELENTVKSINEQLANAQKEKEALEKKTQQSELRSKFLETTNLRDEIARDKVELAILKGDLTFQDGNPVGLIGGVAKPIDEYAKSLEEQYPQYLKVVAGGKDGGFTSDGSPAPEKSSAEIATKAITQAGGKLPTFQ